MGETERLTLTIRECANALGISKNLCYEMAKRNQLPGVVRLGAKRIVVSKLAISQLLSEAGKQKEGGQCPA